ERSVRRPNRRKARGIATEIALVRVAPGGIKQRYLYASAAIVDVVQHLLKTEAVAPHVRFLPESRVDRDHVGLAFGLDPIAAEEQQNRVARLDLRIEPLEGRAHPVDGQILLDVYLEAVAFEFGGHVMGVADRVLKRGVRERII